MMTTTTLSPVTVTATRTPYQITRISYAVESASTPGVVYVVSVDDAGWHCTCLGWKYRGRCYHVAAAKAVDAGKPRVSIMPLPVARPEPQTPCTCAWGECKRHDV